MLLKKGEIIPTQSGKSAVDVRRDTVIGGWGQKPPLVLEAPVRFQGGIFQAWHIGAYSYFNDGAYIRAVRSFGCFVAVGPYVVMGMPEHSLNSISAHIIFPNHDCDWANDFCD